MKIPYINLGAQNSEFKNDLKNIFINVLKKEIMLMVSQLKNLSAISQNTAVQNMQLL